MNIFLKFLFIFYIGCTAGWLLEFCYRGIKSKKIINPGFLVGPYLPIYGFGVSSLTVIYLMFERIDINPVLTIILMGVMMTIIELIGGLSFCDGKGVKLWDYSKEWGNYKGIICPKFSLIWTLIAALYYYFLANPILNALEWFDNNLAFSFILGIFFGVIVIDYVYSTKLYIKLQQYAEENDIDVKVEELKLLIKEAQERRKEKYSFIFSFHQTKPLIEYLEEYKNKYKQSKFKLKFPFVKK